MLASTTQTTGKQRVTMKENGNTQQLITLRNQTAELELAWLRHLLTLAAGALSVLAALAPEAEGVQRLCLSATWVCLALGLLSGAGATYLHVHRAQRLADAFREELLEAIRQSREMQSTLVVQPAKILVHAKKGMVIFLLLAVCFLAAFAVLKTMGWS
jgi:hypothetical protein